MNGSGEESRSDFSGAGFSKAERLCSKKLIASLFEAGQSFLYPPYRIIYFKTPLDSSSPAQVLISVTKKNFPQAHDRNQIRRYIREAYRMNKQGLYQFLKEKDLQLAVAIIYTAKKITTFNDTENKIKVALSRLIEHAGG